MNIGPFHDGTFTIVRVTSIHRNRVPRRSVTAGQAAALAIEPVDLSKNLSSLRKVIHFTCLLFDLH